MSSGPEDNAMRLFTPGPVNVHAVVLAASAAASAADLPGLAGLVCFTIYKILHTILLLFFELFFYQH